MIAQNLDATKICADQLTEGDIIRHFTGDVWQVISEPKYVSNGISFEGERGRGCLRISNHLVEVLCLDVEILPNTHW